MCEGQASLERLNNNMAEELPMNRFRPNIILSGSEPFQEDKWRLFSIGDVRFESVKPCDRCKVRKVHGLLTVIASGCHNISTVKS